MSIFKAVQKPILLDGTGAATLDISMAAYGGAARLVSYFLKYTSTAVGTSVTLSDALSGKAIGSAIVGNTNVDTFLANIVVVGQAVHIVITGGTAAGIVTITLYLDVV